MAAPQRRHQPLVGLDTVRHDDPGDGTCGRCGSDLTEVEAGGADTRAGNVGELRCADVTCPMSDRAQGRIFFEG